MEVFVIGIFAVLIVILIGVIIQETRELRRYRKTANAMIAFGESIQLSFSQAEEMINRVISQNNSLARGFSVQEIQIDFIQSILKVHSEALGVLQGTATYSILERLTKAVEKDGEDSPTEVQG